MAVKMISSLDILNNYFSGPDEKELVALPYGLQPEDLSLEGRGIQLIDLEKAKAICVHSLYRFLIDSHLLELAEKLKDARYLANEVGQITAQRRNQLRACIEHVKILHSVFQKVDSYLDAWKESSVYKFSRKGAIRSKVREDEISSEEFFEVYNITKKLYEACVRRGELFDGTHDQYHEGELQNEQSILKIEQATYQEVGRCYEGIVKCSDFCFKISLKTEEEEVFTGEIDLGFKNQDVFYLQSDSNEEKFPTPDLDNVLNQCISGLYSFLKNTELFQIAERLKDLRYESSSVNCIKAFELSKLKAKIEYVQVSVDLLEEIEIDLVQWGKMQDEKYKFRRSGTILGSLRKHDDSITYMETISIYQSIKELFELCKERIKLFDGFFEEYIFNDAKEYGKVKNSAVILKIEQNTLRDIARVYEKISICTKFLQRIAAKTSRI